jgi:tripartite-type tricarboxylate transporter receptor subunit TctC
MSASSKRVADFSGTTLLATTFAALLLWQAAAASVAGQESYPNRLVRMIVPFPAGGTADVLPRIVGEKLSDKWRQPVIIENRAGAGGNIGGEAWLAPRWLRAAGKPARPDRDQ